MSRAIVLTGAAVVLSMLAKRGRQNLSSGMHSNRYTDRASFKQFELRANNLRREDIIGRDLARSVEPPQVHPGRPNARPTNLRRDAGRRLRPGNQSRRSPGARRPLTVVPA
jgi:hypothetical protein